MLFLPVFLYGTEAWTLLSTNAAALRVFESELAMISTSDSIVSCMSCMNDTDVVQRINIQQLRWLGHIFRMEEDVPARQVFDAGICGGRQRGRLCIRWKDQIVKALSSGCHG